MGLLEILHIRCSHEIVLNNNWDMSLVFLSIKVAFRIFLGMISSNDV